MKNSGAPLRLFSFVGKTKILHMTWLAFFITFFVWFNHAPILLAIQSSLGLSDAQIKTLLILNVALTIPARIVIGMLVDVFGPRKIYSLLLVVTGLFCFFFSFADSYELLALARFLLGFAGAGFVIGIRMISEWFPARQLGLAEGIYKGLGNIGSAAAAVSIPTLAFVFGGDDGWRYATALTGVIAIVYAGIYFISVTDTPAGLTYFKPNKSGGLAVTSKTDLFQYLLMNLPMYATLSLLAWKVTSLGLISQHAMVIINLILVALFFYQCKKIYQVNADIFVKPVEQTHQYKFKQVTVLSLAYAVTFGSELAVVSMLPMFFKSTFAIPVALAGIFGACFAATDILSCPSGGWISDKFGRKKSLIILLFAAAVGFFVLSQITSDWPIQFAVVAMVLSSFFLGSAAGCVFAVVPLIRRSLTGQIAGIVGAYGNVGAVVLLTVFSFVSTSTFFLTIASSILIVAIIAWWVFDEPKDKMFEVMPDGSVQTVDIH